MTPQKMRRLVVETAIPLSFNWIARDMDGSVYAGKVESFYTLGVNASFDIDAAPGLKVTLTVDNITDQVHREAFQGALMGRWASVRLGYEF